MTTTTTSPSPAPSVLASTDLGSTALASAGATSTAPASTAAGAPSSSTAVCTLADLPLERGVPALVAGDQVALFRLSPTEVVAVQHRDPYTGANVLARGLIGSRSVGVTGPQVTLSSPLHKQVWDVRTGVCLDAGGKDLVDLRTWAVEVRGVTVHVLPR